MQARVSFPPKPPPRWETHEMLGCYVAVLPILLVRTTTLLKGMPKTSAMFICVSCGFCVAENTSISVPPSAGTARAPWRDWYNAPRYAMRMHLSLKVEVFLAGHFESTADDSVLVGSRSTEFDNFFNIRSQIQIQDCVDACIVSTT